MRWWLIPIVLALGWFAFTLTPLWALYDLARAVQARDTAYVEHHVNFRTVRVALVRQITAAIKAGGEGEDLRERQKLAEAATALALPLAEALITPKTVIDLLDDGWPESLDLPKDPGHSSANGLRAERLGRLLAFYASSEMRGFRTVVIAVPPDRPGPDQFRIRMRLRGWTWRLVEIEVSETLKARMAARLSRAAARARGEKEAAPEEAEPKP